jgi:hypothetical protein
MQKVEFLKACISEMDRIIDGIKSEIENSTFRFVSADNLGFKLLETGFISIPCPTLTVSKHNKTYVLKFVPGGYVPKEFEGKQMPLNIENDTCELILRITEDNNHVGDCAIRIRSSDGLKFGHSHLWSLKTISENNEIAYLGGKISENIVKDLEFFF